VESKINVRTLQNASLGHTSHHMPKHVNRLNQTYEKLSIQQIADDTDNYSLELNENDFQLSDTLQTVAAFASIFGLLYSLGLLRYKRLNPAVYGLIANFSAVKKFILIRSIRI